ncbi:hypothetical protein [Actinomadura macra]|uniref:hypothetical protein n=1 Tax=Actinomadura macra TaxID=46164 RepID=UPI0012FC76B7
MSRLVKALAEAGPQASRAIRTARAGARRRAWELAGEDAEVTLIEVTHMMSLCAILHCDQSMVGRIIRSWHAAGRELIAGLSAKIQ